LQVHKKIVLNKRQTCYSEPGERVQRRATSGYGHC